MHRPRPPPTSLCNIAPLQNIEEYGNENASAEEFPRETQVKIRECINAAHLFEIADSFKAGRTNAKSCLGVFYNSFQ